MSGLKALKRRRDVVFSQAVSLFIFVSGMSVASYNVVTPFILQ